MADLAPIPMILHCPNCGMQHIDREKPEMGWNNPPHKSHQCDNCKTIWRPADVPTVGVVTIKIRGYADSDNLNLLGIGLERKRTWSCGAFLSKLPEPADCNWPVCGCDPVASKVIEALHEHGHLVSYKVVDAIRNVTAQDTDERGPQGRSPK